MTAEQHTTTSTTKNRVQEKIERAKAMAAKLKQIEKLEREIATAEKKLEAKRRKLAELAEQL
jgi:predicted RNase H-like nuclease (RuvC/YqgF family)